MKTNYTPLTYKYDYDYLQSSGDECDGECPTCDQLEKCLAYPRRRAVHCARCGIAFPYDNGHTHPDYDGESVCEDCYDDLGGVRPPVTEQYPMHTVHFKRDENNRIVVDNA